MFGYKYRKTNYTQWNQDDSDSFYLHDRNDNKRCFVISLKNIHISITYIKQTNFLDETWLVSIIEFVYFVCLFVVVKCIRL